MLKPHHTKDRFTRLLVEKVLGTDVEKMLLRDGSLRKQDKGPHHGGGDRAGPAFS